MIVEVKTPACHQHDQGVDVDEPPSGGRRQSVSR
jgi:hypothetical protein